MTEFFKRDGNTILQAVSFETCTACGTGHTTTWEPYLAFADGQKEGRVYFVVKLLNENAMAAAEIE